MELYTGQFNHLMNRFPQIEHSYETISYNKISNDYNFAVAVPHGKKAMLWFTFHLDNHVCYLLDMNKNKQVFKATCISNRSSLELSLGTIVYGTFIDTNTDIDENNTNPIFIIEDVYFFQGIPVYKQLFSNKLILFNTIMPLINSVSFDKLKIGCYLPIMWNATIDGSLPSAIPNEYKDTIAYNVHHIQFKSLLHTKPSLNVILNKKINLNNNKKVNLNNNKKVNLNNNNNNDNDNDNDKDKPSSQKFYSSQYTMDFMKNQYKMKTIFQVTADIQFDIYHLFAFGKNKASVYYNVAYIPDYKTSVFMNSIFRKIRENENLDYIEESDDEDDFQNIDQNKYVDLDKIVLIECYFHFKFKKWVPLRIMHKHSKIVHINNLVKDFYNH